MLREYFSFCVILFILAFKIFEKISMNFLNSERSFMIFRFEFELAFAGDNDKYTRRLRLKVKIGEQNHH